MSENVEKIYCCDRDNNDALTAAILSNNRRDNDPWAMAAMMNNNMGMNQWMNNPFAYLLFFGLFRNGGFGFGGDGYGFGQGQQNIEMQNQLQAIRSQLQDNQNITLVNEAVKGNAAALSQLAQNLNCDFNSLKDCCCTVQSAIQDVAGKVGLSSERVINAVLNGNLQLTQALKDCCCQTQQAIQRMGYENQLGQKDIINGMITGFDRTNTGLERGFAQVGYDTQRQTCDIITAGNANTQRIIDTLNGHWSDEKSREIQDLKFQLSQKDQNENFARMLWQYRNGCGCDNGCGCGCGSN